MIEALEQDVYRAFGLYIKSEIPLPELPIANINMIRRDVSIEINDLSALWKEVGIKGRFIVNENLVLFSIENTAIFCIKDGKKIIVSPMKGYDEEKVRLFILGSCMGALLMQRKILPLHGSVVAIDGKAYAFIGDSGAGKSTLAQALINRGYDLLSDDVIAVTVTKENIPFVFPSYPQQKLWQESLHQFGMNTLDYRPLFERETKYAVPVQSSFIADSLPLAGIFELIKTEGNDVDLRAVDGLQRIHTLYCHTYRNILINRLGLLSWHFQLSSKIVNRIRFYQLSRPSSTFSVNTMVTMILKILKKGEQNYD